ncbi:pentatricopeptide repeat-containing protein At3g03580 [Elaeis guineensis]|uniref:pentatricopeptide repeat-containing protein At3g03580 n=1 Tax=Elaeis guineensis var. tenera TaxID=51953 RepID=UPI003C6D01A7
MVGDDADENGDIATHDADGWWEDEDRQGDLIRWIGLKNQSQARPTRSGLGRAVQLLCGSDGRRESTVPPTPFHALARSHHPQNLDFLRLRSKARLSHPQWNRSSPLLPQTLRYFTLFVPIFTNLRSSITIALSHLRTPRELHRIHSLLITSGLARSPFFSGKLIAKYSELRNAAASRSVFLSTPYSKNNVFLWNSLIRSHTQNGMFSEALDYYNELQRMKLAADSFTFPSVLGACAGSGDLELGRRIHEHALEVGFGSDLYVGNSLINMYARLGSLDEARKVFDRMHRRDIVSWNTLISGYSANGEWEESVEVYSELRIAGLVPDCFTVESVLPACGCLGDVESGRMIHGLVCKIGIEEDRLVNNGLIAMYCNFENLTDARRIFDMMIGRDTISWNTMIDGYYQSGDFDMALELFREIVVASNLDLFTITITLHVCHDVGVLKLGASVHGYTIRNGYECDIVALNALVAMYSKCGNLFMSRKVFDQMDYGDSVPWNSLIGGYVSRGFFGEGTDLFKSMKESKVRPDSVTTVTLVSMCTKLLDSRQGKGLHCDAIKRGLGSNLFVSNALLDMYSKCDSLEDALKVFESMETPDAVSWNTIISGSVQNGNCNLAFKLLSQMKVKGPKVDIATILGILPACSFVAAKRQGKEIHACIFKLGLHTDVPVRNALIEMYSKCGSLYYAVRIFEHMNTKDIVSWTSLVCAYGMYGEGKKALKAFRRMEETGIRPDHVAFIAVMYACSHAGLVEEGKMHFKRMEKDYNIMPNMEHYACMVDLLARSGKLTEAEKFIEEMPLKPDVSIWGALLSACRFSGETKMAERVAEKIMALDSENTGYHVLISNIYASTGKWDIVGNLRKSMKDKKMKKDPGFSWIEIRNKVYVFGTGDQLVEQSEEVYQLLERIAGLMAKEGYIPDRNFVLQDVEDDDKRYMLCTHSERLAIAFGLLNTKPGTPLQIMKNLRVCGDCHTATKYISKIVQRELLVRDANRFHLFKDGICSCGDYW